MSMPKRPSKKQAKKRGLSFFGKVNWYVMHADIVYRHVDEHGRIYHVYGGKKNTYCISRVGTAEEMAKAVQEWNERIGK